MNQYALVGDVGGTNVRLALCEMQSGAIRQVQTYAGLNFLSPEQVINRYLAQCGQPVNSGCIAIACPVTEDRIVMTNHCWRFSISQLKQQLGFDYLEMINDFTAVSMAIPMLQPEHLRQFGGLAAQPGKPIAVYGAGTGLGVAHLVQVNQCWVSLPGEGGHVDFASGSEEEHRLLQILQAEFGHVSAERVLSGPGLVNLYRAIVQADQRQPEHLEPQQVTQRALDHRCADCQRALSLFCVMMGRFGGNLALTLGTFGGVYLAGGVVAHFADFFLASGFRGAFEDKGRFKDYLRPVPAYLITHSQPGLLGAGAYLRQSMGQVL